MRKLFEKVIYARIKPYLHLLPYEQYVFRSKLDTTKQLIRIIDFIYRGIHLKETSVFRMLGIVKAFDRVWHEGLYYKLIQLKFLIGIIKILIAYLQKRNFSIKINEAKSSIRNLLAGVPPGSILFPILYIVFTYDFQINQNDVNSLAAFYADDTGLVVKSKSPNLAISKLQDAIFEIEDWFP